MGRAAAAAAAIVKIGRSECRLSSSGWVERTLSFLFVPLSCLRKESNFLLEFEAEVFSLPSRVTTLHKLFIYLALNLDVLLSHQSWIRCLNGEHLPMNCSSKNKKVLAHGSFSCLQHVIKKNAIFISISRGQKCWYFWTMGVSPILHLDLHPG